MRLGRRRRDEAEEFAGAVREACTRLGLTVEHLDGEVVRLSGRIDGTVALSDVRAACALEPVPRWPALVQDALQGLAVSLETRVDLSDAAAVRPLLRARVYTEGAVLADDVVRRPLADGLVEVLVALVGGAVRVLPPAVVQAWGAPEDELFAVARDQVLSDGLLTRREVDLGGVQVVALESSSAFAATHVTWLGTYVDVPDAGLLVALPTRHLLLCAPMSSREQVLAAAQGLLLNAEALWREGPGALSPDLWWWRRGGLVAVPSSPGGIAPPAEFVEVWQALPG